MRKLVIVDYGLGNLKNVLRACETITEDVLISGKTEDIALATHVILPGVGAFGDGMKGLQERGLIEPIKQHVQNGKFLLGICLGMQLLFSKSEEFGVFNGLNLIAGNVKKIPQGNGNLGKRKIPHIGWSALNILTSAEEALLRNITTESEAYFVHSYMAELSEQSRCIVDINYVGIKIPAIVKKDNIVGMQFHPEKSAQPGLQLLKNFILM